MNNNDIPDNFLRKRPRGNGFGDFDEPFIGGVQPARFPMPPGPSDFPITSNATATPEVLLAAILQELKYQNTASRPVIRAADADSGGSTLDWSPVGIMDRLMIRNKGPNSVWFSFDKNGEAVQATTSSESFELQANESVNLTHCSFQKIGLRCANGESATAHAIGFQSVAGNQAAAIS